MKQSEGIISENLKKIRESRNLSLDQLSEHTGVSKSMLRQIETGKSSPTVTTIWKIANGLHLSFSALLRKPVTTGGVTDFISREPLYAESKHFRVYPLIPFDPRQSFEVYFFQMDPGTKFESEPHLGDVSEYILLTAGSLKVTVKHREFKISENQLLEFKADCSHTYVSSSETVVQGFFLLSYPG